MTRGSNTSSASQHADLDPRTPVLIGVGQAAERIDDPGYEGLSPIDLAVEAARLAIGDTGADSVSVLGSIDTLACTRQFENSSPRAVAPLGKSTKFPLSVAHRLGASPKRSVLEVAGGQSPQHLTTEFANEILCGGAEVVLLVGAEAMSTVRHLAAADGKPDFSDDPEGEIEDRGFGLRGLATLEQARNGLTIAPVQYALLENARRFIRQESRQQYTEAMATLFAPFTDVAANNPYAAAPQRRNADELITITERNRLISDPYPRFLVARDHVNQAAAVVLTSIARACELGVDRDRWVFLQGHADLHEPSLMQRTDLGAAPSAVAAVRHALDIAGLQIDDIDFFDFYSCFPIAVSNIIDALAIAPDDPRGLTLTGGLPFFGGAGNNYSMHAIAEAVRKVRHEPGSYALVTANGGILSKTSVGIYGTRATSLPDADNARQQRLLDAVSPPEHDQRPNGWATIETYTVNHGRRNSTGVVVGRLDSGARFLAQVTDTDTELLELLETAEQPIGQRVYARAFGFGNRVSLHADTGAPRRPRLRSDYQFIRVHRDDHVLEVTINRPQTRNALHPPAHEELDEVFDAYFADPDLWVAIISGAGDKAFCAGNDLLYTASGKPIYAPLNGFAGLTGRRGMTKPVIAAVNGFAFGGGFEIALACPLVVADVTATFALSEVKVGLVAGAGGLVRLPRCVPPKVANELILTGRSISAEEAKRLGVVNRIASAGEVMIVARALAAEIIAASPTSVRLSLALMERTGGIADTVTAVTTPSELFDDLMFSQDATEGMIAFAAKRAPRWTNQ